MNFCENIWLNWTENSMAAISIIYYVVNITIPKLYLWKQCGWTSFQWNNTLSELFTQQNVSNILGGVGQRMIKERK